MLRSPLALGLYVLAAVVLAFVALAHLVAARKRSGHRLLWGVLVLALPVVGPLAYLVVGRAMGEPVENEDDPYGDDRYSGDRYSGAPYSGDRTSGDSPYARSR